MTRRLGRLPVALVPLLLVLGGVAACGDDDTASAEPTAAGSEAFTVAGDVGSAPEVSWTARMSADDIETETVVAGEGPALERGDSVLAHVWIGNGFSERQVYSSYENGAAELVKVNDQLPAFLAGIAGETVGSRLMVTGSAVEAFGEGGNPQLNIGNQDTVLVIVDLVSGVEKEPSGTRSPAPGWMPPMDFTDGDPSSFMFDGVPEPTDELRKAVLLQGDGPVVESGQTVAVRYLGQVFGGEAPFDENFTTGDPTAFPIGTGNVIQGWDDALVGATVGTRMVIEVPPALGYGEAGNPDAGITGTDTLVFVIDVLAAG